MTTTDLIKTLQKIEFGSSGRAREISFVVPRRNNKTIFLSAPNILVDSTGDGCAGSEVSLLLEN